jgi:hypothetical protein
LVLPFDLGCRARSPEEIQEELARTTGSIIGTVVDAESGAPLDNAFVSADHVGDRTDGGGHFEIRNVSPGQVEVAAGRRDHATTKASVNVVAAQVTSVTFRVEKAPGACCRLAGTWNLTLVLERSVDNQPVPKRVDGTVRFQATVPEPDPSQPSLKEAPISGNFAKDDPTLDESGEYAVDLRPFGTEFAARAARGAPDVHRQAEGYVYQGDQVAIVLNPRIAHGALSLYGKIAGNVIRGRWLQTGFFSTGEGSFLMTRLAPP